MGNRGIDADDEIEALDQSGGIGKVSQIGGEVMQLHSIWRMSCLNRVRAFLQRNKTDPRYFAERRQSFQSHRTAIAQRCFKIAAPANADPQTIEAMKPISPASNVFRVCFKIRRP